IKTGALGAAAVVVNSSFSSVSAHAAYAVKRKSRPRLYHPADDPDYAFASPHDSARKMILKNLIADCEELSSRLPWKKIPEVPDSPHPYHQLYISFYSGTQ